MKSFKDYLREQCWTGYKPVPGKKKFSKGSCVKEDGVVGSVGPTNVVSTGAIAGTGGLGGEPGVNLKKKKTPIILPMGRRTPPKA